MTKFHLILLAFTLSFASVQAKTKIQKLSSKESVDVAATIYQKNKKFSPNEVRIKAGEKISIINDDKVVHNSYSKSKTNKFNTGAQRPGFQHIITFPDPGEHTIKCAIHPKMLLKVIVEKPAPASQIAPTAKVGISVGWDMKFSPDHFSVSKGQKVRISINNDIRDSNTSMKHNLVIVYPDTDIKSIASDATHTTPIGTIPNKHNNQIIAQSGWIPPKSTSILEFTAPNKKGVYPFFCSFPGHSGLGMRGKMIVD